MILMRNVSAAVVLAALAIVPLAPAMAAVPDSAKVVTGMKTEVTPVTNLVGMVGTWTQDDLAQLDKAASVKLFDTRTYGRKKLSDLVQDLKIFETKRGAANQILIRRLD